MTNNLGGMGTFFVPPEQFDVNCMTTAGFDQPLVHNGVIQAKKTDLDIVAQGVGSLNFVDVIFQGTMNSDYTVLSGSVGDVGTACALSLSPSGINASSLLDVIVGTFALQPDIDLNGDGGLDTFGVDSNGISSCTTATGVTIMGHDCACDPRIPRRLLRRHGLHERAGANSRSHASALSSMRALLIAIALQCTACELIGNFDLTRVTESTEALCSDSVDNDGDGLTDCQDWKCLGLSVCCNMPVVVLADDFNGAACAAQSCDAPDPDAPA